LLVGTVTYLNPFRKEVLLVLKDILWAVVAIAVIAFTVYRAYKQHKQKKMNLSVYHEKTDREKESETEIAIERERGRRTPGGGPFGGGWLQ
jgi:hypothetical protein